MNCPQVVTAGGQPLLLDRLIGRGGEGDVYAITGDPQHVVKVYTVADRANREDKIAAMVRSELARRAPLAAFPLAVVNSKDGKFAGFVMKLMGGYRPLHELYAPGPRKHHFPHADYRFLVRAAANIARAFAGVHLSGCVVGDINHSGILVSDRATAVLIDADSFQFTHGGHQFLCRVGVPEYTAPELQGKRLNGVVRSINHDAFGLAVVVFQMLLMGRHPFVGTVRSGDIPPLHENIEHFRYVYAETRNVGMDQPPGTPALSDFAQEVAEFFDRAFSRGTANSRPTAQEWVAALERFEATLVQCSDNPLHYGPKDASECSWCEMERELGIHLFLPHLPRGAPSAPAVDPGRANFDINVVWGRIERANVPTRAQLLPKLQPLSPSPSQEAVGAKESKVNGSAWNALWILVGLAVLVAAPQAWFIALGLVGLGMYALRSKPKPVVDASRFRTAMVDAQDQWHRELDGWRRRAGLDELETMQAHLRSARQQYLDLAQTEHRLVTDYRVKRRDRQLHAYLEGFDIARSTIRGVGPSRLATLGSYGIHTAADVTSSQLASVPGFGEVTKSNLLGWRRLLEARFNYNANETDADRQEMARSRAIIENKAAPLRAQLSRGEYELDQRARRIHAFAQQEDPALRRVHERLEQLRADLTFLGQPIPHPPPPPPVRPAIPTTPPPGGSAVSTAPFPVGSPIPWPAPKLPPSNSTAPRSPLPSGGAVAQKCPKCSSLMKRRLAKRGRNAGGYFWGCSRYPSCKGTLPI